jgi:hypothetical protein
MYFGTIEVDMALKIWRERRQKSYASVMIFGKSCFRTQCSRETVRTRCMFKKLSLRVTTKAELAPHDNSPLISLTLAVRNKPRVSATPLWKALRKTAASPITSSPSSVRNWAMLFTSPIAPVSSPSFASLKNKNKVFLTHFTSLSHTIGCRSPLRLPGHVCFQIVRRCTVWLRLASRASSPVPKCPRNPDLVLPKIPPVP